MGYFPRCVADSQRLGDLLVSLRLQIEPVVKIDPQAGNVRWPRMAVLHSNLPPRTAFLVETVQTLDNGVLLLLAVFAEQVLSTAMAAHFATIFDTQDAMTGQGAGIGEFDVSQFDEPTVGEQGVGSGFLHGLLTSFPLKVPERRPCIEADLMEHRLERTDGRIGGESFSTGFARSTLNLGDHGSGLR